MLKFHLFPRDLEKMSSSGISKTALGPQLLRSLWPSGSFGYALGRHLFQNPLEKGGISAQNAAKSTVCTQCMRFVCLICFPLFDYSHSAFGLLLSIACNSGIGSRSISGMSIKGCNQREREGRFEWEMRRGISLQW